MTGMYSGLDTEAIIQGLVETRQAKIDTMKKDQTKLQWTQDAWKTLNSKIYAFYSKTMTNMTLGTSYMKKATTVSDSSVADVVTSNLAMNADQKLVVSKVAKTAYMTGEKLSLASGDAISASTKLTDLGVEEGSSFDITVGSGSTEKTTTITVDDTMTVNDLVSQMKNAGVNASFDTNNSRFYMGASESGAAGNFTITSDSVNGVDAIDALGLTVNYDDMKAVYKKFSDFAAVENEGSKIAYIASEVAKQFEMYKDQANTLTTEMADQLSKIAAAKANYNSKYITVDPEGEPDPDVPLESLTEEQIKAIDDEITSLEAKKKNGTIKNEETERLETLTEQKSAIDEYKELNSAYEANLARKAEIDPFIKIDEDTGIMTASEALETKVAGEVQAQIDAATTSPDWTALKAGTAIKIDGQDSEIWLNGAHYTSSSNEYSINGLTISVKKETGDTNGDSKVDTSDEGVSLTTKDDASGLYDMIKNFMKEYNALVNEMDKLYNAKTARGFAPLTSEEKEAMTEEDVKTYEAKIKDALLSKDGTLNTVATAFRTAMSAGYTVNGKLMTLADFGVEKLSYFIATDNERNAYHIHGDEDDAETMLYNNKLKEMATSDPETVSDFFKQLSKSLYDSTKTLMARENGYKSSLTIYGDVKLQSDYNDYTNKIKDLEDALSAYEDKWYDKFTAMETALAKLQSNTNSITSLLGG
jgi:flagellar hook-associated protein 2